MHENAITTDTVPRVLNTHNVCIMEEDGAVCLRKRSPQAHSDLTQCRQDVLFSPTIQPPEVSEFQFESIAPRLSEDTAVHWSSSGFEDEPLPSESVMTEYGPLVVSDETYSDPLDYFSLLRGCLPHLPDDPPLPSELDIPENLPRNSLFKRPESTLYRSPFISRAQFTEDESPAEWSQGYSNGRLHHGVLPEPRTKAAQPDNTTVTTPSTADASHRRRKQPANFQCPVPGCGSTFTRHFNLKGHLRSHAEEKPNQCKWPGCGKGCARQHDCKRHEQLHLNIRPYPCEGCKKNFARMDALTRHLLSEDGAKCRKLHEEVTSSESDSTYGVNASGSGRSDYS